MSLFGSCVGGSGACATESSYEGGLSLYGGGGAVEFGTTPAIGVDCPGGGAWELDGIAGGGVGSATGADGIVSL